MPTQPHMVEALLRSQLMAHMTDDERRDLALRFEVRPFSAGQTLIAEGAEGRKLRRSSPEPPRCGSVTETTATASPSLAPEVISGEAAFYAGIAPGVPM